jgi:hypothetical protein
LKAKELPLAAAILRHKIEKTKKKDWYYDDVFVAPGSSRDYPFSGAVAV